MIMSSCSSSVPQNRTNVSVLLAELLTASTDATRVWLRSEMDRTVDPMLHSIFNRLNNKLVGNRETKEEFDDEPTTNEIITSNQTLIPNTSLAQSNELSNHNLINSEAEDQVNLNHQQQMGNTFNHIELPNSLSIGYESEFDPEILAQVKLEIKEEENEMTLKNVMDNTENINHGQVNNANDTQQDLYEPKIGEEDEQMMQVGEDEDVETEIDSDNGEDKDSSRLVSDPPMNTSSPPNQPPVTRQSTKFAKRKKTDDEQQNEVTDQDNQEDTAVEEDDEEVGPSRSVKKKCPYPGCQYETVKSYDLKQHHRAHLGIKPYKCKWPRCNYAATRRFDTVGHIRRMHFKGKQSSRLCDYVEVNEMVNPVGHDDDGSEEEHDGDNGERIGDNQEVNSRSVKRPRTFRSTTLSSTKQKQVVTITLQCPQCSLMFTKDKFNKHLKKEHLIRSFGCAAKDCKQSFDLKRNLSHHLVQSHQSTTQWQCAKCELNFTAYHLLSMHNILQHQFGLFQCSFPTCTFTGEYRNKVYNHYRQHKTQKTFICSHPGCQYQTSNKFHSMKHRRVHLGIKPYKCKWPQCEYAATVQSDTMKHIRMHLKRNSSSSGTQLADPKDFLEVVAELLD